MTVAEIDKLNKRKSQLEQEFAKGQNLIAQTQQKIEQIRGAIAIINEFMDEEVKKLEESNGGAAGCGQEGVLRGNDAGTVKSARDGEPVKD